MASFMGFNTYGVEENPIDQDQAPAGQMQQLRQPVIAEQPQVLQLAPEAETLPKIYFNSEPYNLDTNMVYNPNTKKFKGKFFSKAEAVFEDLGARYNKKFMKLKYETLKKEEEELETLEKEFDKDQYKCLQENKEHLNEKELASYKNLKKLYNSIELQKDAVIDAERKILKYERKAVAMADGNRAIQSIFYLEMKKPGTFDVSSCSSYDSSFGKKSKSKTLRWAWYWKKDGTTRFTPEEIELIGLNELKEIKKSSKFLFSFFDDHARSLLDPSSCNPSGILRLKKIQSKISSWVSTLAPIELKIVLPGHPDPVTAYLDMGNLVSNAKDKVEDLYAHHKQKKQKKFEEETKPLGQFYIDLISTFEQFQKKIKERGQVNQNANI